MKFRVIWSPDGDDAPPPVDDGDGEALLSPLLPQAASINATSRTASPNESALLFMRKNPPIA
jgi:hypothetical protein